LPGWPPLAPRRSGRRSARTFVLARAISYAALFIGFVLLYLPARMLSWAGVTRPPALGTPQIVALMLGALGAALALWCVFAFALIGRGTPAPFDPPRRLVVRGPYRWVRNPMYLGAAVALGAAALFYRSVELLAFTGAFLLMTHLFVVGYEEPELRRSFGAEYESYCHEVRRWWPKLH
jgi:protein-S-isoprenylcysteine O-methyltransferase Ste14